MRRAYRRRRRRFLRARRDAIFPSAAPGLLFDLRSQRAILNVGGKARDFAFEPLLRCAKILFQFSDALFLALDPFGLKRAALRFEFVRVLRAPGA